MIIIFDLLVLELVYEDAYDIYQIINRLLYGKVQLICSVLISM